MRLLPRPSSKAVSVAAGADRLDPTLPVILEYQSPCSAILNMPMPPVTRHITLVISSLIVAMITISSIVKVDRVVTASGIIVSQLPTQVLQPLDTAIVRSIDVDVGEVVHAGQVVARLDPTFAAADLTAMQAQVSSLQAQVSRMQAELDNRPFTYSGSDPNLTFQAAIYSERQSELNSKLENYQQKFNSLMATIQRAQSDEIGYKDRLDYAKTLEQMRRDLEKLNVGSKLNTLAAMDSRAEMQRNLEGAQQTREGAQRDLAALVAERNGYIQEWHNDVGEKLTDALSKLDQARGDLTKAQLHRQLVELRADQDGTILTISKVSVGSVLRVGEQFITMVPSNAPLEIEANISGKDDGHVHVGDAVDVKFDTFPYTQYGMAHGVVRLISADSFSAQDEERNPTGSAPLPSNATSEVFYRSRVTLGQIDLHNTPAGFHLIPGMPVTADIKIGKQTVMKYILGRVVPLATEGLREP